MNEKIYKTMSSTGACSLTVGIIVLATGIVTGIMMIVNGARLLKRYLQKSVETLAARLILSDGVDAEDTILIDVENGELTAKVKK